MEVTILGDAKFRRFALACHVAAGPDFDRHMRQGLRMAGEDIGQAVVTASDIYMPHGYEALFQSRLRATVDVPVDRLVATLTVFARGTTGRRDVVRLERGELRHPVWGRTRPLPARGRYAKKLQNIRAGVYVNPWRVTHIRPRFFSEPVHYAGPRAISRRVGDSVGDVLDEIVRLG